MVLNKLINNSFEISNTMKQQQKSQQGQGMTEYIIILSLVAVAAITVFSAFGGANRAQVAAVANEIAGNHQGAKDSIQLAQNYAKYASDSASYSRNMGNYNSSPDWSNYSGGGSSGSGSGGSGSGGSGSGGSGSGGSGSGSTGSGGSGSGSTGSGGSGTGGSGEENAAPPATSEPVPFGSGQIANQSMVGTEPQNSKKEIYKGINIITVAGNTDAIKKELDKLPPSVLSTLASGGVKIVVVKDSVVEYRTHLKGVRPRGHPVGSTWDTVPGSQNRGTVVVATSGKYFSPSISITLHEVGHAYDHLKGKLSQSSAFKQIAPKLFPGSRYFSANTNTKGHLSESFAEAFARYYKGYKNLQPEFVSYIKGVTGE